MKPRAVLIWSAAAMTSVVADANPITRGLLLLAALNVYFTLLPRSAKAWSSLRFAVVGGVLATAVSAVFDHVGTHVIFGIPSWIPTLGGPVTVEGVSFGAATGLGLAAALVCVLPLTSCLDAVDIVDALPHKLERVGTVLVLSLGLLPRVQRSAVAIGEAQRMRGHETGKLRQIASLAVPVSVAAIEDAMVMSQAMETRGYGSGHRVIAHEQSWNTGSAFAAAAALLAAALILVARIMGVDVDWFPFPSLTFPVVEPIGIVAAVLCGAAALVKKA